jgi:hypothetical protein
MQCKKSLDSRLLALAVQTRLHGAGVCVFSADCGSEDKFTVSIFLDKGVFKSPQSLRGKQVFSSPANVENESNFSMTLTSFSEAFFKRFFLWSRLLFSCSRIPSLQERKERRLKGETNARLTTASSFTVLLRKYCVQCKCVVRLLWYLKIYSNGEP